MSGPRSFALVVALATVVAVTGCSGPSRFVEETRVLSPGEVVEFNFDMRTGDEFDARLQFHLEELNPSTHVVWDVHSHGPTGDIVVHDEGSDLVGDRVLFRATGPGVFSLMVQYPADAPGNVTVDVRITGSANLQSIIP